MGLFSKLISSFGKPSGSVLSDGEYRWWSGNTWIANDTHAGETITQNNLLTSATCYACTKALAETIAGLPSSVYRITDERKENEPTQAAYTLLADQPNQEMDSFTFWEMAVNRIVNRGNFFAEIQRDRADRPIALWPIHNSRVQPMREPDGSLYWQVSNDYAGAPNYSDPTWRQNNLQYISPHNMLNIVGFGSENGIMAPGMLPGAEEIAIDFATRRYGGSFFAKGAVPSGVVEHPGFIDSEAKRAQFRADLNQIHSNHTNAHRVGVLWQGAKYNQISINPEQAQFLETRKFTSHQLCKFYGVPPAIIGDYEDSKFATADAMIRAFVMLTLRSLACRIEKAINRQILNVRDEEGRMRRAFSKPLIYEITLDGLLRGDPKMQAETWQLMRNNGVVSANEWRADVGMNPIEGEAGDYIIVNGGMARLDNIDEQGTRGQSDAAQATQAVEPDEDDAEASLPHFDRLKLAEMIQNSGVIERPAQVRGADLDDGKAALTEAVVEMAQDCVNRIHGIAKTQVERWREHDPAAVAAKLPEFWTKQENRLAEALIPANKLASRVSAESNIIDALVGEYRARYASLDNYQIFDAELMAPLKVDNYVKAEL